MQVFFWQVCSIVALHMVTEVTSCSLSCTCKWKNGKRTAECPSKSLTEIPENIDPETQVLDLSDNNLGKLTKELFLKKQLLNLQRLYLLKCRIKTIHKETFKGLTNLVEMDLSNNFLDNVPTTAFSNCPSLMKLTLSSNPIKDVKRLAFNHLSYLNTLELSGCEISEIEDGAFQGLHSLEWLYLDNNRLKTIQGASTLPKTLKGIELQKNPWTCDCHIQGFHEWLLNFHIPLSSDPDCTKPTRLRGILVKHVPKEELACLPEVLPTTLYLELNEGKNLSLLCHIRAIPEATVSWWFDGQLLQNNTSIAPGIHLIYFVEEGTENKRSELFIYNANADDNGTFVCHAENAAGSAQSNFTIKIVLKEDPVVILVSFPFEYLIYAVICVTVFALLILIVVIICLVKCHRQRKRLLKRDQTKEATLHLQNQRLGCDEKNWTSKSVSSSPLDQQMKQNTITPTTQTTNSTADSEEIVLYGIRTCNNQFNTNLSPMRTNSRNQDISPLSLRRYQLEQNPDLINGTESIGCRRAGDGEDIRQRGEEEPVLMAPGVSCIRNGAEFYQVEQRGLRHFDAQGYPVDYGLPKIPCRSSCNEAYYRTLPCNRMKRNSAANPLKRYSREVEFLSRSVDTPYDHYHTTDVRYTADGYPVPRQIPPNIPHTNISTPPSSAPCCSVNWPPCVPVNPPGITSVSKRSASAQTDTEDECDSISVSVSVPAEKSDNDAANGQNNNVNEVLTESPDEGYEGEPSVV